MYSYFSRGVCGWVSVSGDCPDMARFVSDGSDMNRNLGATTRLKGALVLGAPKKQRHDCAKTAVVAPSEARLEPSGTICREIRLI